MKIEDKVVSRTTAKALARAGWQDYTAWTWMKFTEEWNLIPTYDVESYVDRRRTVHKTYAHYPAPDMSELLDALHEDHARLVLTVAPDACVAEMLFEVHVDSEVCEVAETLIDAMAQLWCVLHAKAKV